MITHKFTIETKVPVAWENKVTEVELTLPCYRKRGLGGSVFEFLYTDTDFNMVVIEACEGSIENVVFDKFYSPESVYNELKDTDECDKADYDYHLDKVKELLR